jgi:D-tyrosyl-tRNA(Tyr) deacylase
VRLVIQKVSRGAVSVDGERLAEIGPGLVILAGVRQGDGPDQADWLADKVANLRIFEDEAGKLNRSVLDTGGSALVVSQFTLYGSLDKGRRPSFVEAAAPEAAEPLVAHFAARLGALGVPVQTGRFRSYMRVDITNEGPVTLILER